MIPPTLPGWAAQARCIDAEPDVFFPEKGGTANPAKAVCSECPVIEQCLEYALVNDERFGVWGGLSERERRRLSVQRGIRVPFERRQTAVCGTTGGYAAHLRKQEPTCLLCRAANTEYQRVRPERRSA